MTVSTAPRTDSVPALTDLVLTYPVAELTPATYMLIQTAHKALEAMAGYALDLDTVEDERAHHAACATYDQTVTLLMATPLIGHESDSADNRRWLWKQNIQNLPNPRPRD